MPWYDEDEDEQELEPTQVLSEPQLDLREKDPYLCTLEIRLPREEVPQLRSLYSPLLQWIDPAFQLLQIEQQDESVITSCHEQDGLKQNVTESYNQDHLSTQSLSIVLFLHEESKYQLNAGFAKHYLESPPWDFHHKIELASRSDMRPVARQDYYESSPDLPLWTVCSVHYGKEQLRFNIFVKNFEEMKQFYSVLTGTDTSASRPGFCTFDLYSQPGLEIKLSLKYSPCLRPRPSKLSALKFRVSDILDIKRKLGLMLTPNGDNTWIARDPDGNLVILSRDETEWCDVGVEGHSTEVSDSGQWSETASDESSWEMCSVTSTENSSCSESDCDCISV
ncbi:protein FAM124A-like [Oculina patagonica]